MGFIFLALTIFPEKYRTFQHQKTRHDQLSALHTAAEILAATSSLEGMLHREKSKQGTMGNERENEPRGYMSIPN